VIGMLHSGSVETNAKILPPFRQGLAEAGYVEGKNLAIEYRWADGRYVIAVPSSTPASLAAKAATAAIPIVFAVGDDPVKLGLVASLARPAGNATGINFFIAELTAKRLGLLRELVPAAMRVAVLVNPADPVRTETVMKDVQAAARDLGLHVHMLEASTVREIDAAFTGLVREKASALFVAPDSFFNDRRVQLALLAARHAVPATYANRDYPEVGGLMSYGSNIASSSRQVGVYTGLILKGAKPADLPVLQPTQFDLVINLSAARTIGVEMPATLLARADEVIE
jgi:putative tryptophan/tyrosine transport system substrate-binding protein